MTTTMQPGDDTIVHEDDPERRGAAQEEHREQGSLILDILIGMAIFALIAIIAVSAIGQYRARAYEQSAVSDAVAVGLAVEAALSDGVGIDPYQEGAVVEVGRDRVALSHGGANRLVDFAEVGYGFGFCVEHDGAEWARYDSEAGGVVESGRDGGCDGGGNAGDSDAGPTQTYAYVSTYGRGLNFSIYDAAPGGHATAPTRGAGALDALSIYLASRYAVGSTEMIGGPDQPTLLVSIPSGVDSAALYEDVSTWLAQSYPDLVADPNSSAG